MNFIEAKEDLKNKLLKNSFKIIRDNKTSIVASYSLYRKIKITENEIKKYIDFLNNKKNYNIFLDYGFYNCERCEHKINDLSYYRGMYRSYTRLNNKAEPIILSDPKNKKIFIKIGSCSLNYFFHYLNHINSLKGGFGFRYHYFNHKNSYSLEDILENITTIEFNGFDFKELKAADTYYKQKIYDCFFELSLLKNIYLKLEEKSSGRILKSLNEKSDKKELEIPKLHYKDDVVKHYLMAVNSDTILAFLSYYQVLEGYFLIASNDELISNVKKELNDPRFDTEKTTSLVKLIDIVKIDKFLNGQEKNQLITVLKKYVDYKKAVGFISRIEKDCNENYYTGEVKVFDEFLKIEINEKDFYSTLAERIYGIRCALVHAKEEFTSSKKIIKYVPSVKNEECILKELPLMRFLAEETLINAAIVKN